MSSAAKELQKVNDESSGTDSDEINDMFLVRSVQSPWRVNHCLNMFRNKRKFCQTLKMKSWLDKRSKILVMMRRTRKHT